MRKIIGRVTAQGQVAGKVSPAPIISGIPEAPKDGALYGRQNGVWDHVPMGTVKSVNGAVPDARGNVSVTPETIIYEDTTVAEALAGLNTALSGVYTKQEVDAKVSALYRFKGSVETVADLPAGAEVGDVYDVLESGANYAWDGEKWDHIGGLTAWGSIVGDIEEQDDLAEYLGTYMSAHNAATATKLATARSIQTNLASTSAADFDGTKDITPGVTGTLPIASGGTGATTAAAAREALGIESGMSLSDDVNLTDAAASSENIAAGTNSLQNLLTKLAKRSNAGLTSYCSYCAFCNIEQVSQVMSNCLDCGTTAAPTYAIGLYLQNGLLSIYGRKGNCNCNCNDAGA
jgi:hypothetical protein